ncbi:unnamed protein product [Amoebophrya sp. A120]|nr:unnamed protein product [Amoebophrya sp. A120]|eukprot:GSA120T00004709001.1
MSTNDDPNNNSPTQRLSVGTTGGGQPSNDQQVPPPKMSTTSAALFSDLQRLLRTEPTVVDKLQQQSGTTASAMQFQLPNTEEINAVRRSSRVSGAGPASRSASGSASPERNSVLAQQQVSKNNISSDQQLLQMASSSAAQVSANKRLSATAGAAAAGTSKPKVMLTAGYSSSAGMNKINRKPIVRHTVDYSRNSSHRCVKDHNWVANQPSHLLDYHRDLRSNMPTKSMKTIKPGGKTYIPGKGYEKVAAHLTDSLPLSHEHPHDLVRERSKPGRALHTRPVSPKRGGAADQQRLSAAEMPLGVRNSQELLVEDGVSMRISGSPARTVPSGNQQMFQFSPAFGEHDTWIHAERGSGAASSSSIMKMPSTGTPVVLEEQQLGAGRNSGSSAAAIVPSKDEVERWVAQFPTMNDAQREGILKELVRKIRFLSKLQYGSITGSQIMWQACADLRLQGHLSERTKQQLLKLESSSINSGQDFISSDLLLSTNAGNVDAADLEAIMPDDPVLLQEELKHLRAELQITKLELLQANMLAEDPELARQHQHGSMLDSLGASSNFLNEVDNFATGTRRSTNLRATSPSPRTGGASGMSANSMLMRTGPLNSISAATADMEKLNQDLEQQLQFLKYREHSLELLGAASKMPLSSAASAITGGGRSNRSSPTASPVSSPMDTAIPGGSSSCSHQGVTPSLKLLDGAQLTHLTFLLENHSMLTTTSSGKRKQTCSIKTKADLAKVLNEVDAFDLHALRTLPKPDAVAKLALTRLLKGLPMEVMELFRGIMLGADFSYFAEMAGGSIFEQLSSNPNNKPGLKQTLFTTKKQILQKCEDVKQFYSSNSFNNNKTSTGTEQLQIFLDRLQLLQSVISDKMDDVQAGFVRHLLQPDPDAKLHMRKILNELQNKLIPSLYKVLVLKKVENNSEENAGGATGGSSSEDTMSVVDQSAANRRISIPGVNDLMQPEDLKIEEALRAEEESMMNNNNSTGSAGPVAGSSQQINAAEQQLSRGSVNFGRASVAEEAAPAGQKELAQQAQAAPTEAVDPSNAVAARMAEIKKKKQTQRGLMETTPATAEAEVPAEQGEVAAQASAPAEAVDFSTVEPMDTPLAARMAAIKAKKQGARSMNMERRASRDASSDGTGVQGGGPAEEVTSTPAGGSSPTGTIDAQPVISDPFAPH